MSRRGVSAVCVGAVLALGAAVLGQAQEPVLSGPKVETKKMPGVEETFGAGGGPMVRAASRPVPLAVFQRALAALAGPDAPEGLGLTEEQKGAIRAEVERFRREVAEWMRANPERAREMRRLGRDLPAGLRPAGVDRPDGRGQVDRPVRPGGGEEGRPAGRPGERKGTVPGGAGGDRPVRPAEGDRPARAAGGDRPEGFGGRMGAMGGGLPDLVALESRVYNLLTEGQRAWVQGEIERWREEEAARRMEMSVRRELERRRGDGETDRPAGAPAGRGILDRLPPEVRERLAAMSEEERARALERLRQRIGGGETDAVMDRLPERLRERLESLPEAERAAVLERIRRRLGGGQGRGGSKPPPSIDEVRVPDPDGGG